MTILYAKAGETEGWRWFHVIDIKREAEMRGVLECDTINGICVLYDHNGELYEVKGRFKIWDERN